MQRSKLFLLSFFLGLFAQIRAEETGGIATLYAENDLSNLVEVQVHTPFFSHPYSARFEKVLMYCIVQKKQLIDELAVKQNAKLFDLNGKKIGKCLQEFVPLNVFSFNDTCSKIAIVALIDKASIDPKSIPELGLTALMKQAKLNEQFDFFKPFMKQFDFEQQDTCMGYLAVVLKQFNFNEQRFEIRLMLFFLHHELIAIFHKRPLQIPLFDATEESLDFGMIYNSKFSEHDKSKLMEVYLSGIQKVN